jgi:uncharacterized protein (UPF0548 family)
MKIHTFSRFPPLNWLRTEHAKLAEVPFSYPEQGATLDHFPKGYDHDEASSCLGQGEMVFDAAKTLLLKWRMFPKPWTRIYDPNPDFEEGMEVGVWFRLFGFWWGNASRIVYTINEPNRFGFAYGTLENHIEKGEELFLIELKEDGKVWYHIRAFSRPNRWYVLLVYPMARFYQNKFRQDSAKAMHTLIEREMLRSYAV